MDKFLFEICNKNNKRNFERPFPGIFVVNLKKKSVQRTSTGIFDKKILLTYYSHRICQETFLW